MGVRTVWRWAALIEPLDRIRGHVDRFEVTPDDITELAYWNGNVSAFRRARRGRGIEVPSLNTLLRAFQRALTPGQLAGLANASTSDARDVSQNRQITDPQNAGETER